MQAGENPSAASHRSASPRSVRTSSRGGLKKSSRWTLSRATDTAGIGLFRAPVHRGGCHRIWRETPCGRECTDPRFANRVPLMYQQGACAITSVIAGMNWKNYSVAQSGLPTGPLLILVHVASTSVPFTSESKDAIASIPEIEREIVLCLQDLARDLKTLPLPAGQEPAPGRPGTGGLCDPSGTGCKGGRDCGPSPARHLPDRGQDHA